MEAMRSELNFNLGKVAAIEPAFSDASDITVYPRVPPSK